MYDCNDVILPYCHQLDDNNILSLHTLPPKQLDPFANDPISETQKEKCTHEQSLLSCKKREELNQLHLDTRLAVTPSLMYWSVLSM